MKRNDSRAIARLKRMYQTFKDSLFVKDGKKWRPCESITEFLELKWVKKLKNTSSFSKHPLEKLDAKQKNRRERYSEKKQIQEGIEEYDSRYDEDYTCSHCMFYYLKGCSKHNISVYGDNEICKDFMD